MGTDNLHHKRKAKVRRDLDRNAPKRAPYDRVLIVCEGEKTEPNYFKEIVDLCKINTANVEVDGSSGSSPDSVLKHAINRYKEAKQQGFSFDRVYCVFDKDSHESYQRTIRVIKQKPSKGVFYAIVSVPCFEYWLILHYQYTTQPYSASNKVYDALRKVDAKLQQRHD